MMDCVPYHYKP